MFEKFKKKYIGSKLFYRNALTLLIPMILQNLITNFVSMLDNIMVGRLGTEQMSGVSIANQFVFIFNITIFGAISGPGIFGAQFYGKGDHEGQKYTVRFRIMIASALIAIFAVVLHTFDSELLSLYLSADDSPEVKAITLGYAKDYMKIMLIALFPFGIGQAYSSVVRECNETKIPMYASGAAVGVNLILDYILIFGFMGIPAMGVKGAAIATVIAKIIEAAVVIVWAHTHRERNKYVVGLLKSFKIPKELAVKMLKKGIPLLFNEFLWVIGMSAIAQCYSVRGLDVVAARNISGTMTNLLNVVFIQMGACISIMIGNKLGAGKIEEAKDEDNKLVFFSLILALAVGLIALPFAKLFPFLYETEAEIRSLSTFMILVSCFAMPIWSFTNACYFTIRSGGRTGITFLFDFTFSWIIQIPLAAVLCYFTEVSIRWVFIIVTFSELLKCLVGYIMVKSNMWIKNLVE